ncbi:MAG: hypothetical protein M1831_003262 [Alyxoria varia]|nr:MAG: hypothetical protein M1831_003262 [Alyxoria varia]
MPDQDISLTTTLPIPVNRHSQLQHILSGVAAMPPRPLLERHIIFEPLGLQEALRERGNQGPTASPHPQTGGSQNVALEKKVRRPGFAAGASVGAVRGAAGAGGSGAGGEAVSGGSGGLEVEKWENRAKGERGKPSPRWRVRLVETLEGPGLDDDKSSDSDGDSGFGSDDSDDPEQADYDVWLSEGENFEGLRARGRQQKNKGEGKRRAKWQVRWYDTPEAGQPHVTSRAVDFLDVDGDVEDAVGFVEARGFRYSTQYLLQGSLVFHHHTVFNLFHLHQIPASISHKKPLPYSATAKSDTTTAPFSNPTDLDQLPDAPPDQETQIPAPNHRSIDASTYPLLDPSGAYIMTASVRVEIEEETQRVALVESAVAELQEMREVLRGVVELGVPDRLAQDTRVR